MRQHDLQGAHYTEADLAAVASGDNTALCAILHNPFDGNAYIENIYYLPIENFTGDDTNNFHLNAQLVAGTEIGNVDFASGTDAAKGVLKALTMTGTDAQRTIAEGGSVVIQREETGTQPARIAGSKIVVEWRSI